MANHSSILAWRIPWTEELGGLQLLGSQRVRHDWSNLSLCKSDHVQTQLLKMLSRTYWIRSTSLGVVGKSFQESLSNLMNTFCRGQFWHSQNGHPNFLLASLLEILFIYWFSAVLSYIQRRWSLHGQKSYITMTAVSQPRHSSCHSGFRCRVQDPVWLGGCSVGSWLGHFQKRFYASWYYFFF